MNSQVHLLKVIVQVHQVSLSVRFPCSLSFGLKSQSQHTVSKALHPLVQGQTQPKQKLIIDVQAQQINGQYKDKYIDLTMSITSPNGKISAGSVAILVTGSKNGKPTEFKQGISKCPDKNAQATYTLTTEFLNVIKTNQYEQSEIYNEEDNQTQKQFNQRRNYVAASMNRDGYHLKYSVVDDRNDQQQNSYLRYSNVGSPNTLSAHHFANRFSADKKNLHSRKVPSDVEKQEIHRLNNRLRNEKQKNWELQKRERQLTHEKKKLQDKLSIKSGKQSQYEMQRLQNSILSDKKSKVISELESEVKVKDDEISDLKTELGAEKKKTQIKKASFDSQYASLLEKYQKSQSQKRQTLMNYNKKIQELDMIEKRHRLILKEREKGTSEEKRQSEKIIKSLEDKNKQFQRQMKEKKEENRNLQAQIKKAKITISDQQMKIQEMKGTEEYLNKQLRKQVGTKKRVQKDSGHQILQSENKKLKEKIKELEKKFDFQTEKYKRQVEKMEMKNIQLNSKLIQTEQSIRLTREKMKNFEFEMKEQKMTGQFQLKKYHEQRYLQIERELKSCQQKLKSSEDQNEQQNKYFMKSMKNIEANLQGWIDKANRYKKAYEQIEKDVEKANEEIMYLNKRFLQISEENTILVQKQRKASIEYNLAKSSIECTEKMNKELTSILNDKNNEIISLKNGEQSLERIVEQNKIQLQILNYKQANSKLSNDRKVFESEIQHLRNSNENLKNSNKSLQNFIEGLNQTINNLKGKVQQLTQYQVKEVQEIASKMENTGNEQVKNILAEKQKQIISLRIENEKYKNQIDLLLEERKDQMKNTNKYQENRHLLEMKSQIENYEAQTRIRELQLILEEKEFQIENQKHKIQKLIEQAEWLLKQNVRIIEEIEQKRSKEKEEQYFENGKGKIQKNSEQIKGDLIGILKEISLTISKSKRIIRSNELNKEKNLLFTDFTAINNKILSKI